MPSVLICADDSVVKELSGTVLWRDDVERRVTRVAHEAITMVRLATLMQFEGSSGLGVETVAGTILNLSEHGMLVETDVPMPLGADLDFKIHLRDAPLPVIGCGQIVRQETPQRNGVRFYGLE